MGFLSFFIFLIIIIGLVVILSVLGFISTVFGSIFRLGRKNKKSNDKNVYYQDSQPEKKERVFGKDEGEYVDYEEIKDKDKN